MASILTAEQQRQANQGSPKMTKNGKRKSTSLPPDAVEYLKAWMMSPEHIAHPYPTEQEKAQIMADTGIELKQLTNWFVNNRKRYWKPRVEARLQQQAHVAVAAAAAHAHAAAVAAVTAAATVNPVTPEKALKPTLNFPPGSGFVSFELAAPHTSMIGPEFARVLAAREKGPMLHIVSENSSSASVSASEGDFSETTADDHASLKSIPSESDFSLMQKQTSEQTFSSQVSIEEDVASPEPAKRKAEQNEEEEKEEEGEEEEEDIVHTPRKKFRRVSLELWRDACQNATNVYDDSLPSLEEATQLFGYTK